MLDINLGNKTLIVGVLIALILSYGMVNFDTAPRDSAVAPTLNAAVQAAESAALESVVAEDGTADTEAVAVPNGGRRTIEEMFDAREKRRM